MKRRLIPQLLALALAGAALAGCAATPDVSDTASQQLQESVRLVATRASEGDPSAAVTELDTLQSRLDSAVDSGDVSAERSQTIQAAIDLVRTDLAQKIADAEAASAAEAAAAAEQAAADKAAADKAAADKAAEKAAEEAAKDAEDAEDDKPGNGKPGKPGKDD
jgi:TolA-binding protein